MITREHEQTERYIADLEAQLTAKDKEVGELKRLADLDCDQLESWKIEGMKLENATLRAEVERLKGREETVTKMIESEAQYEKMAHQLVIELTRLKAENEALKMHPGTLKDQAWIQMLEDLKADVTGFAEWVVINKWHLLGGVWYCTGVQDDSSKHLTTSELYQEYLKQKG